MWLELAVEEEWKCNSVDMILAPLSIDWQHAQHQPRPACSYFLLHRSSSESSFISSELYFYSKTKIFSNQTLYINVNVETKCYWSLEQKTFQRKWNDVWVMCWELHHHQLTPISPLSDHQRLAIVIFSPLLGSGSPWSVGQDGLAVRTREREEEGRRKGGRERKLGHALRTIVIL